MGGLKMQGPLYLHVLVWLASDAWVNLRREMNERNVLFEVLFCTSYDWVAKLGQAPYQSKQITNMRVLTRHTCMYWSSQVDAKSILSLIRSIYIQL